MSYAGEINWAEGGNLIPGLPSVQLGRRQLNTLAVITDSIPHDFGWMVTHLAWMVAELVSSKRETR